MFKRNQPGVSLGASSFLCLFVAGGCVTSTTRVNRLVVGKERRRDHLDLRHPNSSYFTEEDFKLTSYCLWTDKTRVWATSVRMGWRLSLCDQLGIEK